MEIILLHCFYPPSSFEEDGFEKPMKVRLKLILADLPRRIVMGTRAGLPSRQDSCPAGHRRKRHCAHGGSRIRGREIGTVEGDFQGMEFEPS
jgi:hypothetical protein